MVEREVKHQVEAQLTTGKCKHAEEQYAAKLEELKNEFENFSLSDNESANTASVGEISELMKANKWQVQEQMVKPITVLMNV